MAVILTNGVFDCLHPGHYQLLLYCRYLAKGDPVYVAIDSDRKAKHDKGPTRPYFDAEERKSLLLSLTADGKLDHMGFGKYLVDWVDIFDSDQDLRDIVTKREPDYIVKGGDWRGKEIIGQEFAKVHYAPTYYKHLFSTTQIEQRILKAHENLGDR